MPRQLDLRQSGHVSRILVMRRHADLLPTAHLRRPGDLCRDCVMRRFSADMHGSIHLRRFDYMHRSRNLSRDCDVLGLDLVHPHKDLCADLDLPGQRDLSRYYDMQGPGDL